MNKRNINQIGFPNPAPWTRLLHASLSLRCIVTPPDKREDKADTLDTIEQEGRGQTVDAVSLVVKNVNLQILHESDQMSHESEIEVE